MIAYFSNVTGNTHRFITRLGLPAYRIPIHGEAQEMPESFVLLTPTYGAGRGTTMVPRQVSAFLDNPFNASLMRAVMASGNTNFGSDYARAGEVISREFDIPFLYRFELAGMPEDINRVRTGLERFW